MSEILIIVLLTGLLAAVLLLPPLPAFPFVQKFKNWLKAEDEKAVLFRLVLAVLFSRIALLLVSIVIISIHYPGKNIITLFSENGDIPHYLWLAENGYTATGDHANLIVFYPLFPLVIKLFTYVFQNYFISGMIISNVSTVIACGYFYKLIRLDTDRDTASDGVLLFLLYPFSMFLLSCYTEGLFILLCMMTAYYARKGKWILCGLIGMLAALTRNQGIILFGLAVYEYIIQAREKSENTWKAFFRTLSQKEFALIPKGLALLLIPLGFFIYLYMNYHLFGDWFQFVNFQKAEPWFNGIDYFFKNLVQHITMAKDYPGLGYIIYIPQFVMFFVAMALVIYGMKKGVRTSYLLYCAVYTLVSFSSSWLISGPRYMLSCVFLAVPLAVSAKDKNWRTVLLALLCCLNAYYFLAYLFKHAIM